MLVLGATGRVGSQVVSYALKLGDQVTVLVRSPDKIQFADKNLRILKGDVLNQGDIKRAVSDADLVISALSTDGTTTLSRSMPLIIEAMKTKGIKRIITVGTAGILQSRLSPELLRYQSAESRNRSTRATEEHHKVYNLLATSGLEWTIVCPTAMSDKEYAEDYRVERDFLPKDGLVISFKDVGKFTYLVSSDPRYINARVGIAY